MRQGHLVARLPRTWWRTRFAGPAVLRALGRATARDAAVILGSLARARVVDFGVGFVAREYARARCLPKLALGPHGRAGGERHA